MPEARTLLHKESMVVRWGDMDALGHVNNVMYFRYFEQTRVNWLASIGEAESVNTASEGPVIINAMATFLKPIVFPATVVIEMYGGKPGRSSFNTWYEIKDADDDSILYTTGESKVVWADQKANTSMPVPDKIRALLPE